MSRRNYYRSILRIIAITATLISGCLTIFVLLMVIFNGYLLNNLSHALTEIEKYERGQISLEALSSNDNEEIMFCKDDPEGCRTYMVETKSFLSHLLILLTFFTFFFCGSLYLSRLLFLRKGKIPE